MAESPASPRGSSAQLVKDAYRLAERLVSPLGRRWTHVQAVAERAGELRPAVTDAGRDAGDVLVAAAWLHDIGYSPKVASTHLHPLDGALYLRDYGFPYRVVCLVAHHSGARFEAKERNLAVQLSEFPFENGAIMDALDTADLTVGPDGSRCAYDERVNEILRRYEPGDPVHSAWLRARDELRASVFRTEHRMRGHPR